MDVKQALMASSVKQAMGNDGSGLTIIVTQLLEGSYSVSAIAEGSVFLSELVPDEQAVELVVSDYLQRRWCCFEPVQTRYTASPFRVSTPERLVHTSSQKEGQSALLWNHEQFLQWLHFLVAHLLSEPRLLFWVEDLQPNWLQERARCLYRWSIRLIVSSGSGLLFALAFGLSFGGSVGLSMGLFAGLFAGFVLWQSENIDHIQSVETITWSEKAIETSLLVGGVAMFFFVYLLLLGTQPLGLRLLLGWFGIPLVGLIAGLAVGLGGLFSAIALPARAHLTPNLGIRRSGTHGLLVGLTEMVCLFLLFGLFFGERSLLFQPHQAFGDLVGASISFGLRFGLPVGLLIGLPVSFRAGLFASLQHLVLRFWLWRSNALPCNMLLFLDQAASRGMLRKVGGSYRLTHRCLCSYFDVQDEPIPPELTVLLETFTVTNSPPCPVAGRPVTIIYDGPLAASTHRLIMCWHADTGNSTTDTPLRGQPDGTQTATITVPTDANILTLVFQNQDHQGERQTLHSSHLNVSADLPDEETAIGWFPLSLHPISQAARSRVQAEVARQASRSHLGKLEREYSESGLATLVFFLLVLFMFGCTGLLIIPLNDSGTSPPSWQVVAGMSGLYLLLFAPCYGAILWYLGILERFSTNMLYEQGLVLVRCQNKRIIRAKALRWSDVSRITETIISENQNKTIASSYTVSYRFGKTISSISSDEWAIGKCLAETIAARANCKIEVSHRSIER